MPKTTLRSAVPYLHRLADGTAIPASVLSLVDTVPKGNAASRRWLLAALLAVGMLAGGAGLMAQQQPATRSQKQSAIAAGPNRGVMRSAHVDRDGDPLPRGAIRRLGTLRFCQPLPSSVAFSPDGKFLASGGADNRIRLWDPVTGKELRVLSGHHKSVDGVALSADGKWLASHTQDSDVLLWDLKTGHLQRRFHSQGESIGWFALSPNGKVLATSSSAPAWTVRLWDTATGCELPHSPLSGPNGVNLQSFTPDSRFLAAVHGGQYIDLVDVATGKVKASFSQDSGIYAQAFSADGKILYTGGVDGFIRTWNVATGKEGRRYGDGKANVLSLAIAPNGKTLTYGTHPDGLVHILDLATGRDVVPPWKASEFGILSIAYSPDSKRVVVARESIAIHDSATGKRLDPPRENQSPLQEVLYAPDGRTLALWRQDGSLELWDTKTWRKTTVLRANGFNFSSLAFSPDGKYLTTAEASYHQGAHLVICQRDPHTGQRRL